MKKSKIGVGKQSTCFLVDVDSAFTEPHLPIGVGEIVRNCAGIWLDTASASTSMFAEILSIIAATNAGIKKVQCSQYDQLNHIQEIMQGVHPEIFRGHQHNFLFLWT